MKHEDVLDLKIKRNRILLALDIFIGTILFSDCYPTEPMSSYVWRRDKKNWVAIIDMLAMDHRHCEESYEHSKQHLFDAPEYRQ